MGQIKGRKSTSSGEGHQMSVISAVKTQGFSTAPISFGSLEQTLNSGVVVDLAK